MVKSMTGFPRDSDSESESDDGGEGQSASKITQQVRTRGCKLKVAAGPGSSRQSTFKRSYARGPRSLPHAKPLTPAGGTAGREALDFPREARRSAIALPSGLRNVSSVVIVWDALHGPRLRRVLDEPPCGPAEHDKRRRRELLPVTISRARVKSSRKVNAAAKSSGPIFARAPARFSCWATGAQNAPPTLLDTPTPKQLLTRVLARSSQDEATLFVDSVCSKCRECFFSADRDRSCEGDLGELLSSLCLS